MAKEWVLDSRLFDSDGTPIHNEFSCFSNEKIQPNPIEDTHRFKDYPQNKRRYWLWFCFGTKFDKTKINLQVVMPKTVEDMPKPIEDMK